MEKLDVHSTAKKFIHSLQIYRKTITLLALIHLHYFPYNKNSSVYNSLLSSTGPSTLFIFFVNSFRGRMTLWPHPSHLIRISMPRRMIFHRFAPHGWGFFISTISFNSNVFSNYHPSIPFFCDSASACSSREYITSRGNGISIPFSSKQDFTSLRIIRATYQ